MLNMGALQMDALARAREDAFVSKLAAHLREDFDLRHVAAGTVEQAARAGIARARYWGLQFTEDLILYVECMMILGPGFDEDPALPWAREILLNEKLSGDEKMDLIDEHLYFGESAPR